MAACLAAAALVISVMLPQPPTGPAWAIAALGLAALAVAFSFAAWRRAAGNEARLLAIARALDQAASRDRTVASAPDIDAVAALVAREVERLAPPAPPSLAETLVREDGGSSSAPPVASPAFTAEDLAPRRARRVAETTQAIVQRSMAEGRFDIALRPIVALARGEAVAFDAFAEFLREGGSPLHLARLSDGAAVAERAGFENLLLAGTVEAARRVVADATDVPLHVPVSRALLEDDALSGAMASRLDAHRRAARAIVLDMAAGDLPSATLRLPTLDTMLDAGVGLCIDLGDERNPDFDRVRKSGARFVRMQAAFVLGYTAGRGGGISGAEMASRARDYGIAVIADGVATDDEALALADLGIDLMTGPRFAGPKRLRAAPLPQGRAAAE